MKLCKGRLSADDTHTECIAVIDDPISSLSHVFVFNVGQLIRSVFFRSDRVKQVFVLTHSLYFFYELTDPNHERRKEHQKLFRMWKSPSGSRIREMKYEEIQNDYQAYWSVVNDPRSTARTNRELYAQYSRVLLWICQKKRSEQRISDAGVAEWKVSGLLSLLE